MVVKVDILGGGRLATERAEVRAVVEHALADRSGDWQVSIVASQSSEEWELQITGPHGFERRYQLEAGCGEHDPQTIGRIVAAMVPQQ